MMDKLVAANAELAAQVAKLNERVSELLSVARRRQRKLAAPAVPLPPPIIEADAQHAFDDKRVSEHLSQASGRISDGLRRA